MYIRVLQVSLNTKLPQYSRIFHVQRYFSLDICYYHSSDFSCLALFFRRTYATIICQTSCHRIISCLQITCGCIFREYWSMKEALVNVQWSLQDIIQGIFWQRSSVYWLSIRTSLIDPNDGKLREECVPLSDTDYLWTIPYQSHDFKSKHSPDFHLARVWITEAKTNISKGVFLMCPNGHAPENSSVN